MNNYIDNINFNITTHLDNYFKKDDPMLEVCKYSIQNGKKIRPSISMDICNSLLKSTKNVEFPSLTVEYLHAASLIIDDLPCMDNAKIRRDKPSTHVKFGEAITQLTSVVFLSLAISSLNIGINIIVNSEEKKEDNMKIGLLLFSKISTILGNNGIAGGQLLDLAYTHKEVKGLYKNAISMNDMIIKKTGALFELSFLIGWLCGKGDIEKIDDVRNISILFSMMYQILDDIDDFEEDSTDDNKRSKNYAITHGKEKSIKDCLEYVDNFNIEIKKLNINSEYFDELMKYVTQKLHNYT